jgi:hypothetical protein
MAEEGALDSRSAYRPGSGKRREAGIPESPVPARLKARPVLQ